MDNLNVGRLARYMLLALALCGLQGEAWARSEISISTTEAPVLLRAASASSSASPSKNASVAAATTALPSVSLAAMSREGTLRERAVEIDLVLLEGAGASLDSPLRLTVPFFDDASWVAQIVRVEPTSSGGLAYSGWVENIPGSAVVLVNNGGVVSFNLTTRDQRFVVHGSADAGYLARELSTQERPDHPIDPPKVNAAPLPAATTTAAADAQIAADSGASIDVMVLYTPAAMSANGGQAQMNANVDAQVAVTNTIYGNSNVVQRVRLVYKGLVQHTEVNMTTDLPRLQTIGDGYLDDAPRLRDLYGADIVSLWGVYTDYCGLGYVMNTESSGFAPSAYNVVASPACTTGNAYSFPHEMGHNMGLLHDPYVTSQTTTAVTPEAGGAVTSITYAHGYVDITNRFRTVMAYSNQCDDLHISCLRIPYFSNTSLNYNNNAFYSGAVSALLGNVTTSREFQVLNDTRETVANFRTSLTSLTGPGILTFMPSTTLTALKSAGTVTLRVARHVGSTGAVSVNYATADGTAKSGTDYTATSGTLNWADGDTSERTISVTTLQTGALAPARSFNLTLSSPGGGAAVGATGSAIQTATITLRDDRPDTFPPNGVMPTGYATPAGSAGAWSVNNSVSYQGLYSLQSAQVYSASGDFTNYSNSDLVYTGAFTAGNIGFYYKVSSYPSYQQFDFLIDGVVVANSVGGEVDWTNFSRAVTAGNHTLIWRFKSRLPFPCATAINPSAPGGTACADRVWLDSVTLPLALGPLSMRGGIDIDGDGKAEIILRNAVPQMQAARLVNNAFQFSALSDPGSAYRLVGVADFNGDGKSDLALQNLLSDPLGITGDVHIWPSFSSSGDINLRSVKLPWIVQAVGDLDGDGYGDLVLRFTGDDGVPADTGVSYVWFSNGSSITQVRKRGGAPLSWTLLGAIDLNGDGAADMVYVSPDGYIKALMATPNRTCANLSAGSVPSGFSAVKLADFTGNRAGDILVRNGISGATQLLSLSAAGLTLPAYTGQADDTNAACTTSALTLANTSIALPATDPTWTFWAAGDLNGDGITDIVWKQADGTLTVWLMNANGAAPTVINNAGTAPAGFTVFQP